MGDAITHKQSLLRLSRLVAQCLPCTVYLMIAGCIGDAPNFGLPDSDTGIHGRGGDERTTVAGNGGSNGMRIDGLDGSVRPYLDASNTLTDHADGFLHSGSPDASPNTESRDMSQVSVHDQGVRHQRDLGRPDHSPRMDVGVIHDANGAPRPRGDAGHNQPPDMALPPIGDAAVATDLSAPADRDADIAPPFAMGPGRVDCFDRDRCECRGPECTIQCEGNDCEAVCGRGATECRPRCFGNACQVECGREADCRGRCEGGNCQTRCRAESQCEQSCFGNNCRFTCGRGAVCNFYCEGGNCQAQCRGADRCQLGCRGDNCVLDCGDLSQADCTLDCEGNGCRRNVND